MACLDLKDFFCFLWNLLGGNSVHWCLINWTWVVCGSLATCLMYFAVAFELSIFLANCLTLLAGNLFKSMLPSLIIFDTNSLISEENKIYLCVVFLLFLVDTLLDWSELVQHYTIHLQSGPLAWSLSTGQTLFWLYLTVVHRTLQICSKWHPSKILLVASTRIHTILFQKKFWPDNNFLAFLVSTSTASSQFQYVFTF